MTKTDRRVQRTRELLQKALIELIGERSSLNLITLTFRLPYLYRILRAEYLAYSILPVQYIKHNKKLAG